MSTIATPEITYSVGDDLLKLQLAEDFGANQYEAGIYDDLSARDGMEFTEDHLHVNIGEAFGDELRQPLHRPTPGLQHFMATLGFMMPLDAPKPPADPLLRRSEIGHHSLSLQVYPQFQRWLNTQIAIDGPIKREAMTALNRPFENLPRQNYTAALQLRPSQFALAEQVRIMNAPVNRTGSVSWPRLHLQTAGRTSVAMSTPVYQPSPISVNRVRAGGELYTMRAHGLESIRQSLSLLLGAGVLARMAADYQSDTSIFATAQWNEIEGSGWTLTKE